MSSGDVFSTCRCQDSFAHIGTWRNFASLSSTFDMICTINNLEIGDLSLRITNRLRLQKLSFIYLLTLRELD